MHYLAVQLFTRKIKYVKNDESRLLKSFLGILLITPKAQIPEASTSAKFSSVPISLTPNHIKLSIAMFKGNQ